MRNASVFAAINRVRWRWRVRAMALAITVAGAAFAAAIVLSSLAIAIGVAVIVLPLMWLRSASLSSVDAARLIESQFGALDNLVVTAAELQVRPREIRSEIGDEIDRQAAERIRSVDPNRVVPVAPPIAVAAAVLIGCGLLVRAGGGPVTQRIDNVTTAGTQRSGGPPLVVKVTPPSYTRRNSEALENPLQVAVIAGSRIQIESGGATLRNMMATESAALELRVGGEPRFLSLIVVPDTAPRLRVVTPGKDTAFVEPKGRVPIAIESRDDLGLASLSLRYTKASGGGENVSFSEGEIPLRINRTSDQDWRADAALSLEALNLADGDIVVYRAIARDTNPSGTPVQSEQYVIEIGRNAAIVDAGFSLPSEEKKYAISQQMVIYKTEQLIAARVRHPNDWLEQTRMIGIEQRMVRAEVVFLGGGEVEDEVEEAAKSDELTEGRLQNTGRAELLRAINAMSRAEAQLNDGNADAALVFEREALASLEKALDRRRYFLRTLPDRSRIDASRRLTGERKEARSWNRDLPVQPANTNLDALRRVMGELAASLANPAAVNASLAARIAAIDPSSKALQGAAVAIAAATSDASRQEAVQAAMKAVTIHALNAFPASTAVEIGVAPLGGALADELARRPRQ
ncbi:MAG: hypothetical protein K2Y23_11755 [Cyanobacteria bacterium]|nr:hypothetical protein [Cyanobacteriota bacterium]